MCLAIPAKITRIDGVMATVEVGGVHKEISLTLVDEVAVGDYVIVHVGYALNRIDPEEAEQTLELFREVARRSGIPWPEQAA
jgi:hydrogenase expression/formation protein HypC